MTLAVGFSICYRVEKLMDRKSNKIKGSLLFLAIMPLMHVPVAAEPMSSENQLIAGGQNINATREKRMEWFRDAKFGMFIHWGVYSMFEGEYKGEPSPRYAEWIWNNSRIPANEYISMGKKFNPVNYNPEEWARMAKDAGMTYMVITAKHHDGYALFDTDVSDWGVTNSTWGKDLIAPLKNAADKEGLRFGLYYSQSLDWGNHGDEGGAHWDRSYTEYPREKSKWSKRFNQYIEEIATPQVQELTTNYGNLDLFWWDMPKNITEKQAQGLADILWQNQPHIISNGRLTSRRLTNFGDFDTFEQSIPATPQLDSYWESCMTMNNTWGYRASDHDWKSTTELIHNLTSVVANGGNYLLNIGPKPDGSFPQASIDRLAEIGAWMEINGEAIFDTEATPFYFQQAFRGATTQRVHDEGVTLYLHVHQWPQDGELIVLGVGNKEVSAYLLADDERKPLKLVADGKKVNISIPTQAPDNYSSTVVLEVAGVLDLVEVTGVMTESGLVLRSRDADHVGGRYNDWQNGFLNWTNPLHTASWKVDFAKPGRYVVQAYHANIEPSELTLKIGDNTSTLHIPATEDDRLRRKSGKPTIVGEVVVSQAGEQVLTLHPSSAQMAPVNLRELTILPLIHSDQGSDGNIVLNALSGQYQGKATVNRGARHFSSGKEESISWQTTITRQTGDFDIVASYRSVNEQQVKIWVGEAAQTFTLPATGQYPQPLDIHVGQLGLTESGTTEIRFEVISDGDFYFNGMKLYEAGFYEANHPSLITSFPVAYSPYSHVDRGQAYDAHFADKVVDGNLDTRWIPSLQKQDSQWFEIDYGSETHIKTITPVIETRLRQQDYFDSLSMTVSYQDEDGQWQKMRPVSAAAANKGIDVNKKARFWRFEFTSPKSGTFSVSDVKAIL